MLANASVAIEAWTMFEAISVAVAVLVVVGAVGLFVFLRSRDTR